VLTVTASMLLPISSSILRKSLYFFALGYFSDALPSVPSSTSQRATTSPCLEASAVSPPPLPPTPMQAKRMVSLGDFLSAALIGPAIQKLTPANAVVLRKSRRWLRRLMQCPPMMQLAPAVPECAGSAQPGGSPALPNVEPAN